MAKNNSKKNEKDIEQPDEVELTAEMVKVLHFYRQDGAYAYCEIELPKELVENHGKIVSKIEPDILAILVGQLTRKVKELFGV